MTQRRNEPNTKNVTVDVETRQGEVYDKCFTRWQELRIDEIYPAGKFATLKLENGDLAVGIPIDTFERLHEDKKAVSF